MPQPAAIKKAFGAVALITGKQAYGDRAPDSVDAVDRHRAHGIVHMETDIQDLHREIHDDAGDDADHGRADSVHAGAARRDRDQSGQRGVEAHGDVRLSVLLPRKQHTGDRGHGRRDGRRSENARHLVNVRRSRAVEAVPGEPEDEAAQRAERHRVSRDGVGGHGAVRVLRIFADARAEDRRADQRGQAAHHVDHAGAGEVDEAEPAQPAAAPDPAGLDRIDDEADDRGVQAVSGKLRPLRHGARHDGGRRRAEHELEDERRPVEALKIEEHIPVRPADQSEDAVLPHHQAVAEQEEHHRSNAEVHQVFHNNVARVLGAGEAGLHHGEAALHEKHEDRTDQEPN